MTTFADLVFLDGNLLTMEAAQPRARALAVRDGRIAAVGANEAVRALIGPRTDVSRLAGSTMLPGFIDAHTHLLRTGMGLTSHLDLHPARSLEAVTQQVGQAARQRAPGEWIIGRGWDESYWTPPVYPDKADLNRAAPAHPVALMRVCGHVLCANDAALSHVPPGDDAATVDRRHGWLRERPAWALLDTVQPSHEQRKEALTATMAHVHALGITAAHDVADRPTFRAYDELRNENRLTLRVRLGMTDRSCIETGEPGRRPGRDDERLCVGAAKFFADGSIGARNAAVSEPYADQPGGTGRLNYEQAELESAMRSARRAGFQLMAHAIGDRAIGAVIDAYEALDITPKDRARIEHVELAAEDHLDRMKRRGIVASMQPNFLKWCGDNNMNVRRLGRDRDARISPLRDVVDKAVPLAFGSDGMPLGPLFGIHLTVNSPNTAQRLSVHEALRAYTLGGAYAGFSEDSLGSLRPGKWADLIVLDRDPLTHAEVLDRLRVEQVYMAGARVK